MYITANFPKAGLGDRPAVIMYENGLPIEALAVDGSVFTWKSDAKNGGLGMWEFLETEAPQG
jgi:hypothetical protein